MISSYVQLGNHVASLSWKNNSNLIVQFEQVRVFVLLAVCQSGDVCMMSEYGCYNFWYCKSVAVGMTFPALQSRLRASATLQISLHFRCNLEFATVYQSVATLSFYRHWSSNYEFFYQKVEGWLWGTGLWWPDFLLIADPGLKALSLFAFEVTDAGSSQRHHRGAGSQKYPIWICLTCLSISQLQLPYSLPPPIVQSWWWLSQDKKQSPLGGLLAALSPVKARKFTIIGDPYQEGGFAQAPDLISWGRLLLSFITAWSALALYRWSEFI